MTPPSSRSLGFRDPAGTLVDWEGRLLRSVDPTFLGALEKIEASAVLRGFIDRGSLIEFRRLQDHENPWKKAAIVLEHPKVWFPSYPNEWPAEMLRAAAELTLDLAEASLSEGLGLKDATPWNVLFRGTEPVLVDILSFEERHPQDGTWLPYAQFLRTFLYPLLADRELGLSADGIFLRERDGWQVEALYRLLGWTQRLRFFTLVTLPAWAGRGKPAQTALYEKRLTGNPEKATFLLRRWYGHLRARLKQLAPRPGRRSAWSDYEAEIDAATASQKETFLASVLSEAKPRRLLDLGANTGRYSLLSARKAVECVSIDRDAAVVGQLWEKAKAERLPILPLVIDLARPTPGLGWRNTETTPFLERVTGKFDVVLAYAVLHHLWVTEGLSMEATLEWLHSLKAPWVVTEHVAPEDKRVEQLRRGRTLPDLSAEQFERVAVAAGFEISKKERLPGGTRTLYALRRL